MVMTLRLFPLIAYLASSLPGLLDDPPVMGDLSESEELGTSTKDDAITEILEQDW
jgi:hypothetical protein